MSIDIIIFALVAAILVHRLRSVLGTKHGDEHPRSNPFSETPQNRFGHDAGMKEQHNTTSPVIENGETMAQNTSDIANMEEARDAVAEIVSEGAVVENLMEIAAADPSFDPQGFVKGAAVAFKMIVQAFAAGDRETLRPLLSPQLFKDFEGGIEAREKAGQTMELEVHRIQKTQIIDARLGGQMAYVTIDFDVEETSITRDENGNVIDGNPDFISNVRDIWVFARDIRSRDPNWMLIETRTND